MNRKFITIIIIVAFILVAVILLIWLLTSQRPPANVNQNQNVNKVANVNLVNVQVNKNVNRPQVKEEDKIKSELSRIASSFAERFGSYSNQSDFENIKSLQVYMTENMKKWSEQFIKSSQKASSDTSIYYGITTKTISNNLASLSDKEATFTITTQRKEATGTTDNARIYYQDILIKFAKEQGVWKVSEAKWQ